MDQGKLSQILYNIASSEYDIFGLINVYEDSFEMLHDKSQLLNMSKFQTYHSAFQYIQNMIISDLQKEVYENTFGLDVLKNVKAETDATPVTIYIQFKTGKLSPVQWFAITRYNISSVLEKNGFFMYVARPASVEKELNLENNAMRTILNSHFEFMIGGSIEVDSIKYFKDSFLDSPLSAIKEQTYSGFIDQMLPNIHPDDVEEFYEHANPENIYEQLSNDHFIDFYTRYRYEESYYWYHIFIYKFVDNLNSNTHFLFVVYNSTAQKESEQRHYDELHWALQRTEQANHAQKEFISNISHEIRTPLNGIQTMVSLLLQEKELSNATVKKYAKIIQELGNQLLQIVNATLDFSNLSSDTFVYTEDEYNVIDLLKNLQKFVDKRKTGNVTFSFDVTEILPSTLYGDEAHLEQAIINVIDNAFKYTSSGNVSVDINWESEYPGEGIIQIDVADTGIGIPEEQSEKIFEIFTQAEHKERMQHNGIGMGLPITKLILEHMGGSITFDSEPGIGTTFHITIPQTVLNDQPFGTLLENEEYLYSTQQDFISGKQFLVVDDSKMNLEVMQVVLEELGASSTLCENAKDAIHLLEEGNHYDVIFMDHFMPEMTGIEATHHIRNMDSDYCKKVPIIAFTANAVSNAKKMYQREGMNDILLKPLDIKKISKVLKKWL